MSHVIFDNVTLKFPVNNSNDPTSLKSYISSKFSNKKQFSSENIEFEEIKALENISFNINDGDRVGIIGHNGSGKTSLLKVIAGIYEVDQGRIEIDGKILPMLSLVVGIDVEANAYENMYLRGKILGFSNSYINSKVDDIAAFSELGKFLDYPIRTYSHGMLMRLAFAISTHLDADILLMDEWLSVGDSDFNAKANAKLNSLIDKSRILFLASHDKSLIKKVCNKVIMLDNGKVVKREIK